MNPNWDHSRAEEDAEFISLMPPVLTSHQRREHKNISWTYSLSFFRRPSLDRPSVRYRRGLRKGSAGLWSTTAIITAAGPSIAARLAFAVRQCAVELVAELMADRWLPSTFWSQNCVAGCLFWVTFLSLFPFLAFRSTATRWGTE